VPVPLHEPELALSVLPSLGVPESVGALAFAGGVAVVVVAAVVVVVVVSWVAAPPDCVTIAAARPAPASAAASSTRPPRWRVEWAIVPPFLDDRGTFAAGSEIHRKMV
jgi:hypothetical protein